MIIMYFSPVVHRLTTTICFSLSFGTLESESKRVSETPIFTITLMMHTIFNFFYIHTHFVARSFFMKLLTVDGFENVMKKKK